MKRIFDPKKRREYIFFFAANEEIYTLYILFISCDEVD